MPNPLAQRHLDAALLPGESVVWSAQPHPGRLAARRTLAGLGGSAVVGAALIILWTGLSALHRSHWVVVDMFDLLFPAMALILAAGFLPLALRPWRAWRRGRHTIYAITGRRALIVVGGDVTALPLERLDEPEFDQRSDGSGSLYLAEDMAFLEISAVAAAAEALDWARAQRAA